MCDHAQAQSSKLLVFALKVNPDPAPVHHRLLCRFEYPVSAGGLELFRGPRFAPVSSEATPAAFVPVQARGNCVEQLEPAGESFNLL